MVAMDERRRFELVVQMARLMSIATDEVTT
jgi:hypothetical protein